MLVFDYLKSSRNFLFNLVTRMVVVDNKISIEGKDFLCSFSKRKYRDICIKDSERFNRFVELCSAYKRDIIVKHFRTIILE